MDATANGRPMARRTPGWAGGHVGDGDGDAGGRAEPDRVQAQVACPRRAARIVKTSAKTAPIRQPRTTVRKAWRSHSLYSGSSEPNPRCQLRRLMGWVYPVASGVWSFASGSTRGQQHATFDEYRGDLAARGGGRARLGVGVRPLPADPVRPDRAVLRGPDAAGGDGRAHRRGCAAGSSSPASPTAIPPCWPTWRRRSTTCPAAGWSSGIGAAWYEDEHDAVRDPVPAHRRADGHARRGLPRRCGRCGARRARPSQGKHFTLTRRDVRAEAAAEPDAAVGRRLRREAHAADRRRARQRLEHVPRRPRPSTGTSSTCSRATAPTSAATRTRSASRSSCAPSSATPKRRPRSACATAGDLDRISPEGMIVGTPEQCVAQAHRPQAAGRQRLPDAGAAAGRLADARAVRPRGRTGAARYLTVRSARIPWP